MHKPSCRCHSLSACPTDLSSGHDCTHLLVLVLGQVPRRRRPERAGVEGVVQPPAVVGRRRDAHAGHGAVVLHAGVLLQQARLQAEAAAACNVAR